MKMTSIKVCMTIVVIMLAATAVNAQHYIKTRPGRPSVTITTRPPAPDAGSVWIEEDWRWGNGGYSWSGGYWSRPPYRGARWVPGHWVRNRFGWQWVQGHWARRPRRY